MNTRVLRRLHPDPAPLTPREAAAAFGTGGEGPSDRPYVGVNMVATADGKITIGGRSGPIGNQVDRELFHELRARADAVMAGAGTVRTERYGRLVRDPGRREWRAELGLDPDPVAVIPSARLALPADLPILQDPEQRVVILTGSEDSLDGLAAEVDYIRPADAGEATAEELERRAAMLALAPLMRELRSRYGVRTVMCEGGPLLNAALLREGLVDELWLAVAPKLAGGDAATIVTGAVLPEPVELELAWVLESGDGHLFLRYRVVEGA